jgi:hypothetical protein
LRHIVYCDLVMLLCAILSLHRARLQQKQELQVFEQVGTNGAEKRRFRPTKSEQSDWYIFKGNRCRNRGVGFLIFFRGLVVDGSLQNQVQIFDHVVPVSDADFRPTRRSRCVFHFFIESLHTIACPAEKGLYLTFLCV